MKYIWKFSNLDEEKINEIQSKYNVNKLLATVLANRKIENTQIFLKPKRNDFYNPFDMPDMEKAVQRIIKAIEEKEKIIIYGDYDVDGITSITVLKSFFRDLQIEVGEYIPNRLNEGYGLNKEAIKKIAKDKYNLMITVDCGITGLEEIELAKSLGMETIVTDHHEPGEKLPNAIAVVDCKRKDNKYPFRELAGVGVAFKLCQALSKKLNLDEKLYLKYLDIVAIGTIADIVPLIDENRVIAKLGLKLLNQTRNIGISALLKLSGYSQVDSMTVAFGIAPKINACGRMGYAYDALDLLFSNSKDEAIVKARKLAEYNNKRQEYEKIIYEEALEQIENKKLKNKNSIVLGGDNWHHGVVGIVASKITETFYKPCLLVCYENGENTGKGSGRSIDGFNLFEALSKCKYLLNGFGGHSMAVGLSISKENLPLLKEKFEEIASESEIKNLRPTLNIDCQIDLNKIKLEDVETLSELEPIGSMNEKPIFIFRDLTIQNIRLLSEGKHIKLYLKDKNNNFIDAIGFGLGYLAEKLKIGDKIDIVGYLEVNFYNGNKSLQINIKDI